MVVLPEEVDEVEDSVEDVAVDEVADLAVDEEVEGVEDAVEGVVEMVRSAACLGVVDGARGVAAHELAALLTSRVRR